MTNLEKFKRHCKNCVHFRPERPEKCYEYFWTGIGDENQRAKEHYPDSFAHPSIHSRLGCHCYIDSRRNIYKGNR